LTRRRRSREKGGASGRVGELGWAREGDVEEKSLQDQLKEELGRKHYPRAALLAASLGVPEQEVRDLRIKALWQMSAVFRNLPGTRSLAQQYGYSKDQVAEILRKRAADEKEQGGYKSLEPCYDYNSGKYYSFEEWLEQLLKQWDKL
jgi:hypothetical protein